MDPVGGGQPVKVHCHQRWRAAPTPSISGGAAREGEIPSTWAWAVGEGKGLYDRG